MNQHLQSILNFIQQDESLTAEEKNALLKSLKDADKELDITAFKLERTEKVKRTTAILLEETIEELEQKRKAVEAQNRELEIETSLERVRAQAMSMNKPDDLMDICRVVYAELLLLGFNELRNAMINIYSDDKNSFLNYDYSDGAGKTVTTIPYNFHPLVEKQVNITKNANDAFYEMSFAGKELKDFRELRKKNGELDDPKLNETDSLHYYFYSIGTGSIGISTYNAITEKKLELLKRFRNVFNLSYQRYTDITKAEAQAREAQIELALERVRARTMAMQHSDELKEAAYLLFQQVLSLGIPIWSCGFNIWEKGEKFGTGWMSTHGATQPSFRIPLTEYSTFIRMHESRMKGQPFYVEEVSGEALAEHYRYMFSLPDFKVIAEEQLKAGFALPGSQVNHVYNFKHGNLVFLSGEQIPDASDIFKRFTAVFEQTYTRFLDLQKAEAQAREAQIEAALEKVRSTSLAMHHHNELEKVVTVLFDKLAELGLSFSGSGIFLFDQGKRSIRHWITGLNISVPTKNDLPYDEEFEKNQIVEDLWRAKEKGEIIFNKSYARKVKDDFFQYTSKYNDASKIPEDVKKFVFKADSFTLTCAAERNCLMCLDSWSGPFTSEEDFEILKRFARVFEQAYVRFLDLQKAEAQAREAQIEAALEKVRSRSLAMHHSNELEQVVVSLFDRLVELGLSFDGACIYIFEKEKRNINLWIATNHLSAPIKVDLPYDEYIKNNAINKDLWNAIENGDHIINRSYSGESKNDYFRYVAKYNELKVPESVRNFQLEAKSWTLHLAAEKNSMIGYDSWSGQSISSEDFQILIKFAKVFEQAYTRFLDLQKAEAQAREAQIELALERVRARTMAMQKSQELSETAYILYQQFKELRQDPEQLTIGIINEQKRVIELWLTLHGNVMKQMIEVSIDEPLVTSKVYDAWKQQQKSLVIDLSGKELKDYNDYRNSLQIGIRVNNDRTEERRVMNFAFFSKGQLSISSPEALSEEGSQLLQRFAKVFEQTYTRFLDLQKAEVQAREAQIELALERVRARAMAMHNSNELSGLVATLFEELTKLDLILYRCIIWIFNPDTLAARVWMANSEDKENAESYFIKKLDHPYYSAIMKGWKERKLKWMYELEGVEKKSIDKLLLTETDLVHLPDAVKAGILSSKHTIISGSFNNFGLIEASGPIKLSDDQLEILSRFGKVFDLTYTRFNDLQKAEAQAQEARIEAALEKVRSRSLAVHKSDEFKEVISVVFEKLQELEIAVESASINIYVKGSKDTDVYACGHNENMLDVRKVRLRYFDHPIANDLYNAHKKGLDFFVGTYGIEEKNSYYQYQFEHGDLKELPAEIKERILQTERYSLSMAPTKNSTIIINNFDGKPLTETEISIQKRFAKVFEQAYVRFLDLKKAEAQAREAQIEASLERVRSKAMAMHNSQDLSDTIHVFYSELHTFSITPRRCGVGLLDKESRRGEMYTWNTTQQGDSLELLGSLILQGHPVLEKVYESWLTQTDYYPVLKGNEIKEYYKVIQPQMAFPNYTDDIVQYGYFFFFNEGGVYAWTDKELAEEELKIYRRFTSVLSLTYKRYKDLKQAEAQTREAQIEVSLERVRAQTMAMNKSQDLQEVVSVIFRELDKLDLKTIRCGIGLINGQTRSVNVWSTTKTKEGTEVNFSGNESMDIHPVLQSAFAGWQKQEDFYAILEGEALTSYYNTQKGDNYKLPDAAAGVMVSANDRQYYFCT